MNQTKTRACWFRSNAYVAGVGVRKTKWKHGKWHAWGQDHEEYDDGPGNFPIGIVEDSDCNMHTPYVRDVTFATVPPNDCEMVEEEKTSGRI